MSLHFHHFAVRRDLDSADIPVRKHSSSAVNTNELESPLVRKPFSPISSTVSSKANMTNMLEDNGETLQKTLPTTNELSYATPLKTTSLVDGENRTPKAMPIPVPSTPSTVSVPMLTAMTPAPAIHFNTKPTEEIPEEIEQSYEERRLAFMLSKTQITSLIQV